MANPDQLIAEIRYHLDELSSLNDHFEFEKICFYLIRAKICDNVILSTGPVSAGGDQGRDFETFKSYIKSSSIAKSTFIGISEKPLAFPCTTQKDNISNKIKSDVIKVSESGTPIKGIHYFISQYLKTAERHALQSWAKSEFDVDLEIYDRNTISQWLIEKDLCWIAEHFLSITPDLFKNYYEAIDCETNIRTYLENLLKSPDLFHSLVYIELIANFIDSATASEKKEIEVTIKELIRTEEKILILGEAGSGKTTSLKCLSLHLAEEFLKTGLGKIPVFISLDRYSAKHETFNDYVKFKVNNLGINQSLLNFLIVYNRIIFLIDGFDIISENKSVVDFISTIHAKYLISSRPEADNGMLPGFKIAEIQPLQKEQVLQFIQQYLKDDQKLAEDLFDQIQKTYELASLCRNPLILSILISIAKNRKRENVATPIPNYRSEILSEFINNLFKHYFERTGSRIIDRQFIIDGCCDIAFHFQRNNVISEAITSVIEQFEAYLESHPKRTEIQNAEKLFEIIQTIGIFNCKGNNVEFNFHQSFQEYFAAIKMTRLNSSNYNNIIPAFNQPRWRNVVIYGSELVENPDEYVKTIISTGNIELASQCLSKVTPSIKNELIKQLREKITESRFGSEKYNLVNCLVSIDTSSESFFLQLLKDGNSIERVAAISGLRQIKTETAVDALISAYNDEDYSVSSSALSALAMINTDKALDGLIQALYSENPYVVHNAAFSLGFMTMMGRVDNGSPVKIAKAIEKLSQLLESDNQVIRISAVNALKNMKSEIAVDSLIKILENPDSDIRFQAAEALGEIGSKHAIDSLQTILIKENGWVRHEAAEALGKISSETSVDSLIDALNTANEYLCNKIVESLVTILKSNEEIQTSSFIKIANPVICIILKLKLKKMSPQEATDLLILESSNTDFQVKKQALQTLGRIGTDRGITFLKNALSDKNPIIKIVVAKALRNLELEIALELYSDMIDSENFENRKSAISALHGYYQSKRWSDFESKIEKDWLNQKAQNTLFDDDKILNKLSDSLIRELRNEDEDYCFDVVITLGGIGLEKSIEPLIQLRKTTGSSKVRAAVIMALQNIKSETAADAVLDIFENITEMGEIMLMGTIRPSFFSSKHIKRLQKLSESQNYYLAQFAHNQLVMIKEDNNRKQIIF
jgi:HEAT repeat protein/energy-coupling factor transporter ATP-binding protein EcfA2